MKNFLMKDQWSQSRKSKLITAWVGLTLRMLIGVLVFIGSGIFYAEMTKNAETLSLYVLCALVPILPSSLLSEIFVYATAGYQAAERRKG